METEFVASMPAILGPCHLSAPVFSAIGLGLALASGFAEGAAARQNPVIAIDIALEPDATMVQHAMTANARLLKSFPKGFALDETHHPHVTIGVGTETYLNEMLAEPFATFTFSATGASVYQLGSFGTARKELKVLTLTP